MIVAVLAALAGLATVLVALYRDDAVVAPPAPAAPEWDPLPAPADLGRVDFPLSVPGYEPATVDVAFESLARAYADLLAEAPPAVRARAHRRASLRLGLDPSPAPPHVLGGASAAEDSGSYLGDHTDPLEALRVAAALATLDRSGHPAAPR